MTSAWPFPYLDGWLTSDVIYVIARSKLAIAAMRVLSWNVFEDGLADTPASFGFETTFSQRFNALLVILSDSGAGSADFYGFKKSRDFGHLPDAVPINSIDSFFGFIDIVYTLIYHCLGGEARLGDVPLPLEYAAREAVWSQTGGGREGEAAGIPIGGALRSLFLQSALDDPKSAPSADNLWRADAFEDHLGRLTEQHHPSQSPEQRLLTLRSICTSTLSPLDGTLTWTASLARRVWKRETLTLQKWMGFDRDGKQATRGLRVFVEPPAAPLAANSAAALARMCRVDVVGDAASGERAAGADRVDPVAATPRPIVALIEVDISAIDGALVRLRTPTFQSAVRWLLGELLRHAHANPALEAALGAFVGRPLTPTEARSCRAGDGGAALSAIVADVLGAMRAWREGAELRQRHAVVCRHLAEAAPDVVTLLEFDDVWRSMPWERVGGRRYVLVHGRGTASILYDAEVFEVATVPGVQLPNKVRSAKDRGEAPLVGGLDAPPKNSCVLLLRRRADETLVLVISVHMESGPPSDSRKVEVRAAQLRALLAECAELMGALAAQGQRALLVVGGGPRSGQRAARRPPAPFIY